MPADKQAHVRQQRLYDDLLEVTNHLIEGEHRWDHYLQEIANGLWRLGWRHPDRIEITEMGSNEPGYIETGEPSDD